MSISDAALPWVLVFGTLGASLVGGLLAFAFDRWFRRGRDWLAGKLSGLPTFVAPYGCDDCSVEDGEPHRYAGCPGNIRQIERRAGSSRLTSGDTPT